MPEGRTGPGGLQADQVQPFLIESSGIRGRLLRLEGVCDRILSRHAYPEPVARLLAEMLALCGGLASLIKYDGIFTLQASGDGPLRMMVVDVTSEGEMRGYAGFDRERLAALMAEAGSQPSVPQLFGKGHLAFTVDQGSYSERYQGIVALNGETLADCLQHYFMQSEQLQSGIVLAAGRRRDRWVSGALVLQRLPEEAVHAIEDEDDWRRAMVLQASCSEDELLDDSLKFHDLLYRLFHEEGVRVFEPRSLTDGCRCSRAKLENVLKTMPRAEIEEMKADGGAVEVTCEFCTTLYRFDDHDLDRIYAD